jgi:alkylation response protein AidB-like acyl-CoA dehydrogenase
VRAFELHGAQLVVGDAGDDEVFFRRSAAGVQSTLNLTPGQNSANSSGAAGAALQQLIEFAQRRILRIERPDFCHQLLRPRGIAPQYMHCRKIRQIARVVGLAQAQAFGKINRNFVVSRKPMAA